MDKKTCKKIYKNTNFWPRNLSFKKNVTFLGFSKGWQIRKPNKITWPSDYVIWALFVLWGESTFSHVYDPLCLGCFWRCCTAHFLCFGMRVSEFDHRWSFRLWRSTPVSWFLTQSCWNSNILVPWPGWPSNTSLVSYAIIYKASKRSQWNFPESFFQSSTLCPAPVFSLAIAFNHMQTNRNQLSVKVKYVNYTTK